MSKRDYWPERVYVSPEAQDASMTRRVLSALGNIKPILLDESSQQLDPLAEVNFSSKSEADKAKRFSFGKKNLLLADYRGRWLKSCPGTKHHVCCNLWVVNPGEGCPYDCTYCALQSYFSRNPSLKIFVNTDKMLAEIDAKTAAEPERLFRICTGELMDSLVWDELTGLSTELIPFFARKQNAILELKTKSAVVENVISLKDVHMGRTVISFSVNAETVAEKDEAFAASMDERIEAAYRVIDAGYRVGLHFDPLVYFDGYEDAYREVINRIFKRVSPEHIAWISLSTLRYPQDMQRMMMERFPGSKLPFGEQILAKDGKIRYAQPIRFRLIDFVWKELWKVSRSLPIYMCMESPSAWRYFTGGPPAAGSELVEVYSRRGNSARWSS